MWRALILVSFALIPLISAQTPLEASISDFTLANGMRWIVAPTASTPGEVSLQLYVDAGIAQETLGRTGLTATLGDMFRMDLPALQAAGAKRPQILVNWDRMIFRSSWPVAGMEPWFETHAKMLKSPELKRFAEARDAAVVRRNQMHKDGGHLLDDFLATAFLVHPYRFPYYGFPGELDQLTLADAMQFLGRYAKASNTIAVAAGDVTASRIRELAVKYFGALATEPKPEELRTVEPPPNSERRLLFQGSPRGAVLVAYHCPSIGAADAPVYGVLRTMAASRLKSRLTEKEKLASRLDVLPYPAMKYPYLILVMCFLNAGADSARAEAIIHEELAQLADAPLPSTSSEDPGKLAPFLLATELADWQAMTGTWRSLFRYPEKASAVTLEQVHELARRLFVPGNRTVAVTR